MENVNIREYLYHGICGSNASFGSLYIFESMLKTGYIVNNIESKKYDVDSKNNIYEDMGYSPRISLGFYPLAEETYKLSKNKHPNFYGKSIIDKVASDHNIKHNSLDEFIMNCSNLNKGNVEYAWCTYYNRITSILSKELLKDLKISNYGILVDEICIDESIDLRRYLEYVAVNDKEQLDTVIELLQKYDYYVPIIEFPSGLLMNKFDKTLTLKR